VPAKVVVGVEVLARPVAELERLGVVARVRVRRGQRLALVIFLLGFASSAAAA
jgi:hypothetical protein